MMKLQGDKQLVIFILISFLLGWGIEMAASILVQDGAVIAFQILCMILMYVPFLAVLLSRVSVRTMGWKPRIRKNIRYILLAWLAPAILTAIGTALYFMVFPTYFDLSGASLGAETLRQLEAQGISYSDYILICVLGCLTYAPFLNMFLALGEEVGWRGFLYPRLQAKFGRRKGWLLGGIIWGAWHWPLICLAGYEYGTDYAGFPVAGMLCFCLFTVVIGILCDWLYERSGSIWLPSLFHGAINAAGTVPLAVCSPGAASTRLLGPAPNGIIAGLPFLVLALLIFFQKSRAGSMV